MKTMRYVILRDDDTNALTPVDCLERLYRPFLNRGLPVNLAIIPDVATDATRADGTPEGFLTAQTRAAQETEPWTERSFDLGAPVATFEEYKLRDVAPRNSTATSVPPGRLRSAPTVETRATIPIGTNRPLVGYLLDNPGFHVAQHGCHHDHFEFDRPAAAEISRRLERGTRLLIDAGFPRPQTFVAPHDKLSRVSFREVAKRFDVISTGWFEWRRLPPAWWPRYLMKKFRNAAHWRVGRTLLLSHPGCLLSCHRGYDSMLHEIIRSIHCRRLTVLVTHWWEYFRDGHPDEAFIRCLHRTAEYLATQPEISVLRFPDLKSRRVPIG